jgi:hypothetical protein
MDPPPIERFLHAHTVRCYERIAPVQSTLAEINFGALKTHPTISAANASRIARAYALSI